MRKIYKNQTWSFLYIRCLNILLTKSCNAHSWNLPKFTCGLVITIFDDGQFQVHVKLTVRVNTTFTIVSGQGAIVPTINVRTFSNMSIAGYLAGRPNGNMITRKIRKPVPEDSLVSQEVDEIETGQTEPRVSVYQC